MEFVLQKFVFLRFKKYHLMTRKLLLFFNILAVVAFFDSCSTKVDLYGDYKDIAIVYGLLDYTLDTNYIRIGKAFMGYGDAEEIAQIADSCNYPGKLEAKLIETQTNRVIELDTITMYNKEAGIFYNDVQPVYYTTENINPTRNYKLEITKPDGSLITSSTSIVGGESFKITNTSINLSSTAQKASVTWSPATNASLYEIILSFEWEESDVTKKIEMSLGTHKTSEITMDHGAMTLPFSPQLFFNTLQTYFSDDPDPSSVVRRFNRDNFKISIAAGGQDLATYIEANAPSSSIAQSTLDWTNIKNGYGVFSSRVNIEKRVPISTQTAIELTEKGWGFVVIE